MKKIVSLLLVCLVSLGVTAYSKTSLTKVNLILKMDDGKVGNKFFEEIVEEDEIEDDETKSEALDRINKELSFKLREGLHEKSNDLRFGEYEDAPYTVTVYFLKSNEDGQRASFRFEVRNNNTGKTESFTKSDRGGTFGSKFNLLGDCLKGAGKKAAKDIENIINGKEIRQEKDNKYVDDIYALQK